MNARTIGITFPEELRLKMLRAAALVIDRERNLGPWARPILDAAADAQIEGADPVALLRDRSAHGELEKERALTKRLADLLEAILADEPDRCPYCEEYTDAGEHEHGPRCVMTGAREVLRDAGRLL